MLKTRCYHQHRLDLTRDSLVALERSDPDTGSMGCPRDTRKGTDMYRDVFRLISEEASAGRAYDHLVSVCRYHRIQASPGFREASAYCVDRLLEVSQNARVIHYPADPSVRFWHFPSFGEWSAKQGLLEIAYPARFAGRLADYQSCPISLIQRSKATRADGISTEVVYAGRGTSAGDYRGARGKIAVCDSHCPRHVYDAAVKAGVAGVILYRHRPIPGLRTGAGVPGVRQYNSFWWNEHDLLGFVLTPEQGQDLVSYLVSAEARKKPVGAWALVASETYPGSIEVVTSLIPGSESKEILIVAHLCHPKPSAGDNASGVAVALEAHRVITELIERGSLPRPRYGIRFLLVPEVTGTFAYLSRERGHGRRLLFGLNLDMVGQNQDLTGSTLCIESPPLASASFTPYLLEEIVGRAFSRRSTSAGTGDLPLIRMKTTPFSGGSDHAILSDPMVGVPTPMLMQWPDKYYHTSGDTIDKVSPDTMRRAVIAASVYAYTCALAADDDLVWLVGVTGRGLRRWVTGQMGRFATHEGRQPVRLEYKAEFLLQRGKEALRSVGRLAPRSRGLRALIKAEERVLARCIKNEAGSVSATTRRGGGRMPVFKPGDRARAVYRRLLPGPVDAGAVLMDMGPRWRARHRRWLEKERAASLLEPLVLYWMDGRRSIEDISRLIAAETGHVNPEFIDIYIGLLEEAGLVEVVES
jgi:aminopeptidase YwaD